jgi:hypothetical protein
MNFQNLKIDTACHLTISDRYADSNISNNRILTGFDGINLFRSFLSFNIEDIPANANVSYAILRLYVNRLVARDKKTCLYIIPLKSRFDGNTTFINQPQFAEATAALEVGRYFSGWIDFNITNTFYSWIRGSVQNKGVLLKSEENKISLFDISGIPQYNGAFKPHLIICCAFPGCDPVHRIVKSSILNVIEQNWEFSFQGIQFSPAVSSERVNEATFFVTNKGTQSVKASVETSADEINWAAGAERIVEAEKTAALAVKFYGKYYRVRLESDQNTLVEIKYISQDFN